MSSFDPYILSNQQAYSIIMFQSIA
uniref:Uncharacterized protein n=1 Tax=Rhizophora mucronata TaxID=61149 RepID=A0A2P2QYL9_RHIMU